MAFRSPRGSGILDMIARCREAGLPTPEFRQSGGQFIQTLRRPRVAIPAVTPDTTVQVTGQVAVKVLAFCRVPRSGVDIQAHIGIHHRTSSGVGDVAYAGVRALGAYPMLFVEMPADAKQAYLVQLFTTKFVVLGVLFAATIWCGRLYKASKHQASMNYHRANALKTFQAFIKATDDEGTRNAVLLETTRSIFAITPTGYLDVSEPSGEGATKVIEVMKNLTQSK